MVLMRNQELFTGIEVKEKDGNVVGTSKIAARKVTKLITQSEKLTTPYSMTFFQNCVTRILD